MWEDETKRQMFGLIRRGGCLCLFVGSLSSFAGSFRSFVIVCGRLLAVFGGFWSFAGDLRSFAVICGHLWSPVVVACFSNYVKDLHGVFNVAN